MPNSKSLITMELKRIRDKHGITNCKWANMAKVPVDTVNRYLSASVNIPNFPAVCAMLKCLGESIDDFYNRIDAQIDNPSEAMKIDTVLPAVTGDINVDIPQNKAEIQERIIVQAEAMKAQNAAMREKQNEIAMLEMRIEMADRIIEEKDRTIATLEDINRRRLEALKAICSAQ